MHTILLLDDLTGDASVLASALRVEGFNVVIAKSATDAREAVAREHVAIAIVDLMLRGEDGANGLELARELRTASPETRVLLTSAYHLSERQLERSASGVSGFIPKPYDIVEVVTFIRAKAGGPPSSRSVWPAEPASGVVDVLATTAVATRSRR